MKRRLIILGISLLVITNVAALVTIGFHRWCKHTEECSHEAEHSAGNYLCQQLSLSEAQVEKMGVLKQSFRLRADRISSALHEKRTLLVDLLTASDPDSQEINMVLREIDTMQAELQKHVIRNLLKEKEILTSEQQQKFFSIVKERLLQEARCCQTNGIDPLEDSCNVRYQESNNHLKNDERR